MRALIVDARKAAGLSQEQLAKALGKPHSYVWKLENGERELGYVEAQAYAAALKLEFTEFTARYSAMLRMQAMPARKRREGKKRDDP